MKNKRIETSIERHQRLIELLKAVLRYYRKSKQENAKMLAKSARKELVRLRAKLKWLLERKFQY